MTIDIRYTMEHTRRTKPQPRVRGSVSARCKHGLTPASCAYCNGTLDHSTETGGGARGCAANGACYPQDKRYVTSAERTSRLAVKDEGEGANERLGSWICWDRGRE